ncbi:MAG: hypothetical protein ACREXY_08725 [Gammaproteobacteria bacterium]
MVEEELPLELSGVEVVHLIDALRNADNRKGEEEESPCLRPLVIKLAHLYRVLVTPGMFLTGPLALQVTRDELWLLRSKVRTGDVGIDKSLIGVNLSLKIYAALESFVTGLSEFGIVDIAQLFEEAPHARAESSQDTDPGPVDVAGAQS